MRLTLGISLVLLTACGGSQESCDLGPYAPDDPPAARDPRSLAVATSGSGPGRISFVNSIPVPGATIAACGPTVAGCAGRLKIVFNVRPDMDLQSQRLRVSLFTESQARVECTSTTFDLAAGQTFPIEVSCPGPDAQAATPFRTAVMIVEAGAGPSRIEQDWNVPFVFAP
jgi:hypothetical protein